MPQIFNLQRLLLACAAFAIMMVAQLLWVKFKMPETKGISLEEVSRKLTQ